MHIKNTIADSDLETLRAAIAGQVCVPGQAGGRHHGPPGPSRIPVVPDGQRGGAPVPVTAPAGGAAPRQFSAGARVLLGRFLRPWRARHGFVSRSAGAA